MASARAVSAARCPRPGSAPRRPGGPPRRRAGRRRGRRAPASPRSRRSTDRRPAPPAAAPGSPLGRRCGRARLPVGERAGQPDDSARPGSGIGSSSGSRPATVAALGKRRLTARRRQLRGRSSPAVCGHACRRAGWRRPARPAGPARSARPARPRRRRRAPAARDGPGPTARSTGSCAERVGDRDRVGVGVEQPTAALGGRSQVAQVGQPHHDRHRRRWPSPAPARASSTRCPGRGAAAAIAGVAAGPPWPRPPGTGGGEEARTPARSYGARTATWIRRVALPARQRGRRPHPADGPQLRSGVAS